MRRRALLSGDKKDYSQEYFTMVVTVGGDITWTGSTIDNILSYSKDNGDTWNTANSGTTISVSAGDKVLWKGTPTPQLYSGIGRFSGATNTRYSVEGNAMSLLYGDNFKGQTSLSGKGHALLSLFIGSTNVTSAKNLSLPATTLAVNCYGSMFNGCTSLTIAPKLPAKVMAMNCYHFMFDGCASLTTAPELPATTLKQGCYYGMFQGCTSLTTAPKLPATTLEYDCYHFMFDGCASLTTAPELPATTLKQGCYYGMFQGCTSLTTAPKLPATTLEYDCYHFMFDGCASLTTAPELPATTLKQGCYYGMFYNCRNLNSITCLATNISASDCTKNWVSGVASSGTFTKAASMDSWTTGTSGIPEGWTVRAESVVLYPEDYDTPVSGYITSGGKWAKATSSGKQTWVFHDVTEFQGGTCNLYLGSRTGYYAFVKEIPTAAGSVQYASGWSNRATLSQDIADIPIPSDAVYLCFYYHGSGGNMYPSKVEIYPQE